MAMGVFQCPICELKFHFPSELNDHMAKEHPDFWWERPPGYEFAEKVDGAEERAEHLHPARRHSEAWVRRAACRGMDTGLFFGSDEVETDEQRRAREIEAKAVCSGCSVMGECLEFALATRQKYGIWGGLNEKDRASEQRKRARATRVS